MKLFLDNCLELPISDNDIVWLKSLIFDVDEINKFSNLPKIYIDWQDYHDEYSCERTDPCPDFYGYYTIRFVDNNERCGDYMNINELDNAVCIIFDLVFHEEKKLD